jgi:hypothetical protein
LPDSVRLGEGGEGARHLAVLAEFLAARDLLAGLADPPLVIVDDNEREARQVAVGVLTIARTDREAAARTLRELAELADGACEGSRFATMTTWWLAVGLESELAFPPGIYFRFEHVVEGLQEQQDLPTRTPSRLAVDLDRRTLTLDGVSYDVSSLAALRWVKVLADHPGEWISSANLRKYDSELDPPRTTRWLATLPEPIRSHIDSEPGKGSRIRLD